MQAFTGNEYAVIVKIAKKNGMDVDELAAQIRKDRAEAVKHRGRWTAIGAGVSGALGALAGVGYAKNPLGAMMAIPAAIPGALLGYWGSGLIGDIKQLHRNPGLSNKVSKGFKASPEQIRENAIKRRIYSSAGVGLLAGPFYGSVARNLAGPGHPHSYIERYRIHNR